MPNVTAAHFHNDAAGANGGVARELQGSVVDGEWVSSGVWQADEVDQLLTPELVQDLLSRRIYANVHAADFAPGEVRGQVLP